MATCSILVSRLIMCFEFDRTVGIGSLIVNVVVE